MPLHFQCRFTDDQLAAIDAAAHVTDARTGMTTTLTRQQVVLAIVETWRIQQAVRLNPPPPPAVPVPPITLPEEPEPSGADRRREELHTLRAVALQAMEVEPEPLSETAAAPATEGSQPEPALADIGPPGSDPAAPVPVPAVVQGKLALAERVRALRAEGLSYPRIVRLFNDEGIATFSGKPGAKWSNSTIVHLEQFRG